MPANTYEPIATTTLTSASSSVTFGSIPQTYTDLILIISAASTVVQDPLIRLNSDSGTNYSYTTLTGNGATASSARATNQTAMSQNYFGSDSTTLGENARVMQFLNYSNTTTFKTMFARGGRGNTDGLAFVVNLWRSTAAITSITSVTNSGNYIVGSTFTLYGIKAA
jgi:hypothetical protein